MVITKHQLRQLGRDIRDMEKWMADGCVETVAIYERFRIERHPDGYHVVEVRHGIRPLTAKAIGPFKTISEALDKANDPRYGF